MSTRRFRPPCPAVKLHTPHYWHFDEDSWSWQRRVQTHEPELAATLTLTREELELVRRAFISRADVHPCDWPKARETARSVEAKLYDALRKAGLA